MLNNFCFEYLFSYSVSIGALYRMKESPLGLRTIGYITDGKIWGDKIQGEILPGGGDWCVLRPDGISCPDVRCMIKTSDGAEIYMHYTGKMDAGEDGYNNYCASNFPPVNYITTAVEFETDAQIYLWLNRKQCFGIGQVDRTTTPVKVQYDVYALNSLPDNV